MLTEIEVSRYGPGGRADRATTATGNIKKMHGSSPGVMGSGVSAVVLALLGLTSMLWLAIALISVWGMAFAAETPIRKAYLNDMTPSKQRATVLSFASLMESTGGAFIQA